jgi:hypothetical protein
MKGDGGRWREVEGSGGRWREMEGSGGRWREKLSIKDKEIKLIKLGFGYQPMRKLVTGMILDKNKECQV